MKQLTYGHDSEFALKMGNTIYSALDHLPAQENKYGRIFPDNMNAEIAINPVDNLHDFHEYTEGLLDLARELGFDLVFAPVVKYPDECMAHPDAMLSGCNPDLSAYTMEENVAPDFAVMDATRSLGAHMHVSIADMGLDPFSFARWYDIHVVLPMLFREEKSERRSMYGSAGCLRVKPYGVECRTLSSCWVGDEYLREFVWEGTHRAVESCAKGETTDVEHWEEIPQAINNHDLVLAKKIIDRLYLYGVKYV